MKAIYNKIIFWSIVALFVILLLGFNSANYIQTFFYTVGLLPIAIGCSTIFKRVIIIRWINGEKLWKTISYLLALIITALWLEMLLVIFAFMFLANYEYHLLHPHFTNILEVALVMFCIVLIDGFRLIIQQVQHQGKEIEGLKEIQLKQDAQFKEKLNSLNQSAPSGQSGLITFKVNRKNKRVHISSIIYIESLSDYVKIYTTEDSFQTRLRISKLESELPQYFLRCHRSFLINSNFIASYSKEFITVQGEQLPISRSYKKVVMEFLQESKEHTK